MNRIRRTFAILLVSLMIYLGLFVAPLSAQGTREPFTKLFARPYNVSWSPDSKKLIFQYLEEGVQTDSESWFQYHVETKQLTTSTHWPLQVALTPAQQRTFEVITDDGKSTFIFSSPNNRYIVYASQQKSSVWQGYALAIADLRTNEHKILDEIAVGRAIYGLDYSIKWSSDSTAFLINLSHPPVTRTYLVANFATSVNSATATYLDKGLPTGNLIKESYCAFDVSSDAKLLLLQGNYFGNDASIFVWNTQNLTQSKSIRGVGSTIIAAAFLPGSQQKIRFVGSSGLVEYDLSAGTQTVLDADINSSWVFSAWFSPDGNNIGLHDYGESGQVSVYVVSIRLPSTATSIPTSSSQSRR